MALYKKGSLEFSTEHIAYMEKTISGCYIKLDNGQTITVTEAEFNEIAELL